MVRRLDLTLSDWKDFGVFKQGVIQSDFSLRKSALAAEWRAAVGVGGGG